MRPSALNKICAYPVIISWVIGAIVLNAFICLLISKEVPFSIIVSDWSSTLLLIFAFFPVSLLGYFAGMFTVWPMIRVICSRFNGAPLRIGDRVQVLTGPHKGKITEVYEIFLGQGRWELASINLNPEEKAKCTDIHEVYTLYKIKNG